MNTKIQPAVKTVSIESVSPDANQARKEFEPVALAELAASIREHGIINPLLVVRTSKDGQPGTYMIIGGERRWKAAQMAGLTEIPVLVMKADDITLSEVALIDNMQRAGLKPIEEAKAFQDYIVKTGCTPAALSNKLGLSLQVILSRLSLLELPQNIQMMVNDGMMPIGHAEMMTKITPDQQTKALAVYVKAAAGLEKKEFQYTIDQITGAKTEEAAKEVTEKLVKQVSTKKAAHSGQEAADSIKLPNHDLPEAVFEKGMNLGDIIGKYMEDLKADGKEEAYCAVGELLKTLVANKKCFLPGNQMTRPTETKPQETDAEKKARQLRALRSAAGKALMRTTPDPKRDAMKDMEDEELETA